jgi:hypothetical protein
MRKLCTNEVGGAKMKKNEKKMHFVLKKYFFFTALVRLLLWLCISKMVCRA